MARPTKRTPTAKERILAAIKLGATYELAAKAGGISYMTLNRWLSNPDDPDFCEFCEAVNSAEAAAAQQWLKHIDKAARDGSWQAAAWKLERRYPESYGRSVQTQQGKVTHEHSGPNGSAIPIAFDANAALAAIAAGSAADS